MGYKTRTEIYKDSDDNDINVAVMTFGARTGIKIQTKILRVIGKFGIGFFSMVGSKEKVSELNDNKDVKSMLDTDIDFSNVDVGKIAELLMSELGEDDVLGLIMRLVQTTKINGKPMKNADMFDDTFAGEYSLLFEVLKLILEVNFKSFLANGTIGKILSSVQGKVSMVQNHQN